MDEALVLVSLREHPTGVPQHQSEETGPNPLLPEPDEAGAPVRLPLLARGGLETQRGLRVPAESVPPRLHGLLHYVVPTGVSHAADLPEQNLPVEAHLLGPALADLLAAGKDRT